MMLEWVFEREKIVSNVEKIRWGYFFRHIFALPPWKNICFLHRRTSRENLVLSHSIFSPIIILRCAFFFWKHISPNRKTNFSSFSRLIFLFSVPLSSFSHPFFFRADVEPIWRWRSDGTQKGVTKSREEIYRQRKLMWKERKICGHEKAKSSRRKSNQKFK